MFKMQFKKDTKKENKSFTMKDFIAAYQIKSAMGKNEKIKSKMTDLESKLKEEERETIMWKKMYEITLQQLIKVVMEDE